MSKCLICGKEIKGFNVYCANVRCQHEYELKLMVAHSTREYKEYNFWSTYTLTHIEMSEGMYVSKDPLN